MVSSARCRAIVEQFEGLRLESYQDGNGIWTIGFGHTGDVRPGDTCTPFDADQWLRTDLGTAEGAVNRLVTVLLNQNQFDALCSFVYNIGQGNFAASTLLKLLNEGNTEAAAMQFFSWIYVKKMKSDGLIRRRHAEENLFMEAV